MGGAASRRGGTRRLSPDQAGGDRGAGVRARSRQAPWPRLVATPRSPGPGPDGRGRRRRRFRRGFGPACRPASRAAPGCARSGPGRQPCAWPAHAPDGEAGATRWAIPTRRSSWATSSRRWRHERGGDHLQPPAQLEHDPGQELVGSLTSLLTLTRSVVSAPSRARSSAATSSLVAEVRSRRPMTP